MRWLHLRVEAVKLGDAFGLVAVVAVVAGMALGIEAAAAYINGGYAAPSVTPGHLCAALAQAGVAPGTSREGHTLRSVSCSGSGRVFNVRVVID